MSAPPRRPWPERIRRELFSDPANSALTVVVASALGWLLWRLLGWVRGGVWDVVRVNRRLLLAGRLPQGAEWRVWPLVALAVGLIAGSLGRWRPAGWRRDGLIGALAIGFCAALLGPATAPLAGLAGLALVGWGVGRSTRARPLAGRLLLFGWASLVPLAVLLLRVGGGVGTERWGGLLLNLLLALVGIGLGLPLGILLALGRTSRWPWLRLLCTTYVELIRAGPLIAWLFLAHFALPLVLPWWLAGLPLVVRAMGVLAGFSAAYLAEIVRGGLLGLDRGQGEAAAALGLRPAQALWWITLPQALRAVVPSVLNQLISLWKDTSLVFALGFLELLGAARAAGAQTRFLGHQPEALFWAALVFWALSQALTSLSHGLERRLGLSGATP